MSQPEATAPPSFVEPLKVVEVADLPSADAWFYEVKWDGYRCLAWKHGREVRLLSRNNRELRADFPQIVDAIRGIKAQSFLIDGEIVALDKSGHPSFSLLQRRAAIRRNVFFYAFDLIHLNGSDWRQFPIERRRERLEGLLTGSDTRYSTSLDGEATKVIDLARAHGLEGIVAKRRRSFYEKRSSPWVKLKLNHAEEFVVGGFEPDGHSLDALLIGHYAGTSLQYVGRVHAGLRPHSRAELSSILRGLRTARCPFRNLPEPSQRSQWGQRLTSERMQGMVWVRPAMVVQVAFTEWTANGKLRHARFVGVRHDKRPRQVQRRPT